jgi:signal transduction histidine kinase
MVTPATINRLRAFLSAGHAAQAGWLLFTLLALCLALPGIAPYRQLLQTICTDAPCLTGQLTQEHAPGAIEALGGSLPAYAGYATGAYLLTYSLTLLTAAALIWRKPTQWAAVFGAFALSAASTNTLAQATASTVPLLQLPAQLIHFGLLVTLLPFFGLIPDGHFRPAWLRWIALAIMPAAALVAFDVVGVAAANVLNVVITALILGGLIYRYRSLPASRQREQVTWALAAAILLTSAPWVGVQTWSVSLEPVPTDLFAVRLFGTFLLVGALTCLAVAFLSDELFRVDVVLSRALVYSLLSLFVIAGYVLVVGSLSLIFQSSGSLWLSLVATGLVAALFQPVREQVQRFVNQLLYGERAEPYKVIAALGQRLEATFASDAVLPTIAQVVQESLQLPYAAIALEQNGVSEVAAAAGVPLGEQISFALTYQGALVGHLLVTPRRGAAALDAADRTLLADLAQQAGIAVHGVRLTAELRQMANMLQQSRERLVLALEEERRRLRRDLHDDLAPTLVGLSLRAGTIGDLIETDPPKARMLAENLDNAIRDAVGNIRRLVYDLRPPALDDLGLLAAIRERAREYSTNQGLQVEVDAPDTLPHLPAAVEVAAYRIVQEGLLNVVKHAQAHTCHIAIMLGDGLTIEIMDDGIGLPASRTSGVGLRSIRERAEELRGTCEITQSSGTGTRLAVSLPVESRGKE